MQFSSITLEPTDLIQNACQEQRDVRAYLKNMMNEYQTGSKQCLFLPSMVHLSRCFQCSAAEVHEALNELTSQDGCDLLIMGFDSPITLWYPARIS